MPLVQLTAQFPTSVEPSPLVPSMLIVCRFLVVKPVVPRRRLVEYAGLLLGLFAVETAASYTGRADLLALSITLLAV